MTTECLCVVFSEKAYNAIINETFNQDPFETGGILLGHILDNGLWIVMEVLPPGQKSVFQHAYFEYDEQFVNYVAQSVASAYKHELSLLGLWHRHPGSMDTFSSTDNTTNHTYARLNSKGAISGIVNIDPSFRLTMYHVSADPLCYTKVDTAVGDKDLIPAEYFTLKHYPEKGLNPVLPVDQKHKHTNTDNHSANNSTNRYKNQSNEPLSEIKDYFTSIFKKYLDTKYFFLLIFVIGLGFSICTVYSYSQLKGSDDIKSLHRVFYSQNPTYVNTRVNKINEALNIKKFTVNSACNKPVNIADAENKVKMIVIFLAIAAVLTLTVAFIPRKNKWKIEWLIIGISLILSIIISAFLNYLSISYFIKIILFFSVFCFVSFVILFFSHSFSFKNKTDTRFWFQKYPKLYLEEEKQIKQHFDNTVKNVENGILSFYIPTNTLIDKQFAFSFQLVYSSDYDKSKEIKVYFVNPELDKLLGDKINDFPCVAIDNAGEWYLEFSKTIKKDKMSGIEVICKLNEWLQKYQNWKTVSLDMNDIKR